MFVRLGRRVGGFGPWPRQLQTLRWSSTFATVFKILTIFAGILFRLIVSSSTWFGRSLPRSAWTCCAHRTFISLGRWWARGGLLILGFWGHWTAWVVSIKRPILASLGIGSIAVALALPRSHLRKHLCGVSIFIDSRSAGHYIRLETTGGRRVHRTRWFRTQLVAAH